MVIRRRGYTRKDGTRVKSTRYRAKNLGHRGRGPKIFKLKPGGLPGYHARNSTRARHAALHRILMTTPAATVWHRVHALSILTKRTHPNLSRVYSMNARYIKK